MEHLLAAHQARLYKAERLTQMIYCGGGGGGGDGGSGGGGDVVGVRTNPTLQTFPHHNSLFILHNWS